MTTDTEALRAQFEQYVNPDGDVNLHWRAAGFYAGAGVQESWLDFQAGYAAAIAIQKTPAMNDNAGRAGDAYRAGHAAAAAETAAAVSAERQRCIDIIERYRVPVGNSAAGEMAAEWTMDALRECRDAIRAGAKEPSDA